jgi:hypothetical protein
MDPWLTHPRNRISGSTMVHDTTYCMVHNMRLQNIWHSDISCLVNHTLQCLPLNRPQVCVSCMPVHQSLHVCKSNRQNVIATHTRACGRFALIIQSPVQHIYEGCGKRCREYFHLVLSTWTLIKDYKPVSLGWHAWGLSW